MKLSLLIPLMMIALVGCHRVQSESKNPQTILLTSCDSPGKYVGKVVTLRGLVSNSKIPTILGIDVDSDDPDLRGQIAEATGVVESWEVTAEEWEATKMLKAGRGPGVFYRLRSLHSDSNAQVTPLPASQ